MGVKSTQKVEAGRRSAVVRSSSSLPLLLCRKGGGNGERTMISLHYNHPCQRAAVWYSTHLLFVLFEEVFTYSRW
jgi:hypothetical protein